MELLPFAIALGLFCLFCVLFVGVQELYYKYRRHVKRKQLAAQLDRADAQIARTRAMTQRARDKFDSK